MSPASVSWPADVKQLRKSIPPKDLGRKRCDAGNFALKRNYCETIPERHGWVAETNSSFPIDTALMKEWSRTKLRPREKRLRRIRKSCPDVEYALSPDFDVLMAAGQPIS
jgi:hypothetical protein